MNRRQRALESSLVGTVIRILGELSTILSPPSAPEDWRGSEPKDEGSESVFSWQRLVATGRSFSAFRIESSYESNAAASLVSIPLRGLRLWRHQIARRLGRSLTE
jgi:hypothetical protein